MKTRKIKTFAIYLLGLAIGLAGFFLSSGDTRASGVFDIKVTNSPGMYITLDPVMCHSHRLDISWTIGANDTKLTVRPAPKPRN